MRFEHSGLRNALSASGSLQDGSGKFAIGNENQSLNDTFSSAGHGPSISAFVAIFCCMLVRAQLFLRPRSSRKGMYAINSDS